MTERILNPYLDQQIWIEVNDAKSISEVKTNLINAIRETKINYPNLPINFVSGETPFDLQFDKEKFSKLYSFTRMIQDEGKLGPFVFSSATVFLNEQLLQRFNLRGAEELDYTNLWVTILRNKLIDNLIRIPGWEKSEFAKSMTIAAKQIRMNIVTVSTTKDALQYKINLLNKPDNYLRSL